MSANVVHKKIFNLVPETDYVILVTAVTSAGRGPSQTVATTTRHYARQYIMLFHFANKLLNMIHRNQRQAGFVLDCPHMNASQTRSESSTALVFMPVQDKLAECIITSLL